jgi:NAD(P)-dependent dehydrogenase (short-subunit alcohol dehydrogenase family)
MKTILITGARSGLGLELVKSFSAQEWRVIAACKDAEFPAEHLNINIEVLPIDLLSQESIDVFVSKMGDRSLDILINCAGMYDNSHSSVDDESIFSTLPEITHVFQVNALAPKILSDRLIENLKLGSDKLIFSISSGMGSHSQLDEYNAEHWVYSSSKAALNMAMHAFAVENKEIKSVLFSPGWMNTSMGGKMAPIEPSVVAQKIYELVTLKLTELPNGKVIDREGKVVDL